jgi:eukaryotic-like serine/threonine-protein kinase
MVSAVSQDLSVFGVQRIGRYEVLDHLASGGMGHVYLARTTGLGGFERQVVVKTLDLSVTDDDEAFVMMFLDEARLVGSLHHQYIAPVYEVGCDDDGRYFLVMDFVHGESAEAVFRTADQRLEPIPLAFALTVVSCVASALDYAHTLCAADGTPLEIVHRDVSLSNVMIGHDGAVKLIDFGIAKSTRRTTQTVAGTLKGKMGYLAPEQALGRPVDHRTDIFALGIVLYELTTGRRAFRDTSDLITLERITSGEVTPPREIVADYPPELERIVMKALRVDPDRRFQSAGALGRQLEALAAGRGLALGHAPIVDVMIRLFGDRRVRRRLARSSQEVETDPLNAAVEHELLDQTPVVPQELDDPDALVTPRDLAALPRDTPPELGGVRDPDAATLISSEGVIEIDELVAREDTTVVSEPVVVRFATTPHALPHVDSPRHPSVTAQIVRPRPWPVQMCNQVASAVATFPTHVAHAAARISPRTSRPGVLVVALALALGATIALVAALL